MLNFVLPIHLSEMQLSMQKNVARNYSLITFHVFSIHSWLFFWVWQVIWWYPCHHGRVVMPQYTSSHLAIAIAVLGNNPRTFSVMYNFHEYFRSLFLGVLFSLPILEGRRRNFLCTHSEEISVHKKFGWSFVMLGIIFKIAFTICQNRVDFLIRILHFLKDPVAQD